MLTLATFLWKIRRSQKVAIFHWLEYSVLRVPCSHPSNTHNSCQQKQGVRIEQQILISWVHRFILGYSYEFASPWYLEETRQEIEFCKTFLTIELTVFLFKFFLICWSMLLWFLSQRPAKSLISDCWFFSITKLGLPVFQCIWILIKQLWLFFPW